LDQIIESGLKLIELGPTRAHTYYQIGEAYFRQKVYDKALDNFQIAVGLNPWVIDPYINVLITAIITGDEQLEQDSEANIRGIKADFLEQENTILRIIPVYRAAGRYERVITDLERLIKLNPEKIEYYSSLAMVYAELGDNDKAEEAISRLLGRTDELDASVAEFIAKLHAGTLLNK